jgi:hypothetical protein
MAGWLDGCLSLLGVATVLKMKVFLLIGCCLPKIHIHSIC